MNFGFQFVRLRVSGNQKKSAEIAFTEGLNIITGASDTGKSYIFQCIDYVLGARKTPKTIEEGMGYDTFELEIKDNSGQTYSLKRVLTSNNYLIKKGSLSSNEPEEEYAERLTDDPKNISSFLLGLCGFDNVKLKKNVNETIRLSFRDICGLTVVDEQKIITEESPVYYSGEIINRTREQSLFYFLLTGLDAKDFIEQEDPKTFKAKINGKIELVKELIERTQTKLNVYKGLNIDDLTKNLQNSLDSLSLEYNSYVIRIDELKKQRNIHHIQKTKKESDLIFKKELIERFELLRKHYLSDLERLKFITEGNFLLNQLTSVTCPVCGSELKDEHIDCLIKYENDNILLEEASKSEVVKISLKMNELNETINNLRNESGTITNIIVKLTDKISKADSDINRDLKPVSATLKDRIDSLFIEKAKLNEYNRLRDSVTSYAHQINDLNNLLKTRTKQNRESVSINKSALDKFCNILEETLNEWKFPNTTSLIFDTKYDIFDIVINGNQRRSRGKGVRAVTYASFIISLMKYCNQVGRPYSYNIVIDSPLTTYKQRDKKDINYDDEETIDRGTEQAFFESISKMDNIFQIIILDNKEPSLDLIEDINYIHFSGEIGVGRSGFFKIN